jgi:hypothetical protein
MTDLTINIGKTSIDLKEIYPGMKPWKMNRVKDGVEALLEKIQKNEYIKNLGGVERGHLYASEGYISIILNPEKEKRIRVRVPDKDYIYELDKIQFSIRPPRSHREFIKIEIGGGVLLKIKILLRRA